MTTKLTLSLSAAALLSATCVAALAASANYKVVNHISVPDGRWDYATFDASTNKIYVAQPAGTAVLDVKSGKVSMLTSPSGGHITLPIPGTTMALVTQGGPGMARVVDLATDKVLADIPAGKNPDGAAYDPATKLGYAINHSSGDVTPIDFKTLKAGATIQIGGTLEFPVADGLGKLFINIEDTGEIAVIDTKAGKLLTKYKMKDCEGPTGLAYDAADKLLISACGGSTKFIKADTGAEVASIATADGADAAMYDAKNHVALIPSGSGELDIISVADPAKPVLLQKVSTARGARTGTLDTNTGMVYMMSSQSAPAAPAAAPAAPAAPGAAPAAPGRGRGPGALPGSYALIVVGPA